MLLGYAHETILMINTILMIIFAVLKCVSMQLADILIVCKLVHKTT